MRQDVETDRADSLDFLRSMLVQLRGIAESQKFEMVAYLIEMAYLETEDAIRGERPLKIRKNN